MDNQHISTADKSDIATQTAEKVVEALTALDKSKSDIWRGVAGDLFFHLDGLLYAITNGEKIEPCQGCYEALRQYMNTFDKIEGK